MAPSVRRVGAHVAAACVLLALASTAHAVMPHEPDVAPGQREMLAGLPYAPIVVDPAQSDAWAASDPAWIAFLQANEGPWHPRWDRRSGRFSFAWGAGITWLPDGGRIASAEERAKTLDVLEQQARAFMAANQGLYRFPQGVVLTRQPQRSLELDNGRIWLLRFEATVGGIPVAGDGAYFHVNNGRLVQFGLGAITDDLAAAPTVPAIDVNDATVRSHAALGKLLGLDLAKETVEEAAEPRLYLLPWSAKRDSYEGAPGHGFEFRLVWQQSFRVLGRLETWTLVHDAVSGERLALFDTNHYACPPPATPQGRVVGGVYLGYIEEVPETVRPMPFAQIDNGGPVDADFNGIWPYNVGNPASTTLSGTFFNMNCNGCNTPAQAFAQVASYGPLSLGTGGVDVTGNGFSTKAERNCFYHLNIVRQLAATHLNDVQVGGFFTRVTPANVNLNQTCNAFWDGNAVNFFRSGGGCNNTGEIADVMQHEWGHGLDQFTNPAGTQYDGARGEGFADVVAFLATHDPNMSAYFFQGNRTGIRNADDTIDNYTRTNVGTFCPSVGGGGDGPLGFEVHCEGMIHSQTWFHLGRNLRTKYGDTAGWYATERLFFNHMLAAHWSVYQNVPPGEVVQYDGLVLVDDLDGNLANGIPDGTEINEAFVFHEIEGTPLVGDSAECTPPTAPVMTLASAIQPATGLYQVHVTWPAVAGAAQYEVYRNDVDPAGSYQRIATVVPPATDYFDDDVLDGVTYNYRVAVFSATGCVSSNDNRRPITVGSLVSMQLASWQFDDAAGNANAVADPGETLVISADVANLSSLDATSVVATLSTTVPGVTLVDATANVGNIAGGALASTAAPHFTIRLDPTRVSCGDSIPFFVELEAVEGCSFGGFTLTVGTQDIAVAFADEMETNLGWTVTPPPGGRAVASSGIWVREDPRGAGGSQLTDDHTPPPGVACWVTGNAPMQPAGGDDVDNGCTTLVSPVIDLAGQTGLTLEYWWYWTIATSFDDQLVFEISNDAGGNWLPLQTIDTPVAAWTLSSFDLETVIGAPLDQVQIRVTACDEGAGSLIEAQLDDVRIERRRWICSPPFPIPSLSFVTFGTGDSAALGGSGNGDGVVDPGERIRIPVDLTNGGNADAVNVVGTMTVVSGSASVSDGSAPWPDIAIGATETTVGAPAHFEITVPGSATCGSSIRLRVHVDYEGSGGGTFTLDQDLDLVVGAPGTVPVDFLTDDFEGGDNGFTHGGFQDDWIHDAMGGAYALDPPAAFSGTRCWGNDLGIAPRNGEYNNNANNFLQTPAIDCTGKYGVHVGFWRWLTIETGNFDDARLLVNGTLVWQVPAAPNPFEDSSWTYVEYDISAIADDNPAVVIRWELQSDGGETHGGWTIDDLRLFHFPMVCNPVGCGAPPVPGPLGPYLRATPNYGTTNAEFTWVGATPGAGETYVLERTTGFRPAATWTTLTPAGYASTTFDDTTADRPLLFYRAVLENCNGQRGPASP